MGRDISHKELGNLVDAAFKGSDMVTSKIYVKTMKRDALDTYCANRVAQNEPASSTIKETDRRKQFDAILLNNSVSTFRTVTDSSVDLCEASGMQISVKIPSISKSIKLNVKKSSSVADVKVYIERHEGILLDDQILMYAGQQLDDRQMLTECGLRNDQALHVLVCPADKLCIFINIRETRTIRLDAKSWYTVADVKLMIETMFGYPSCTQILKRTESVDDDVELADTRTLKDQYIKNNDVLMLHPNVQIFIKTWEGRTLTILASMLDTEVEIRSKIKEKSHITEHVHYLSYRGRILPPGVTLEMYKVERNSTITVCTRNTAYANQQDDKQILSECGLGNGQELDVLVCPASNLCISINIGDTRTTTLDVKSWHTISDVKLMIESLFGFPSCTQILMRTQTSCNDPKLTDTLTLKALDIRNNDVLMLYPNVQIFIKTLEGRTLTILSSMLDTEVEIRSKIKEKSHIKEHVHYLSYRGRILSPGVTLEMFKVESNSTITICTRNAGYVKPQEEI
uniref:Ubiquitin-like domain-containing protein n=1 Tax=Arundo donax TaxID=35708 RepID=A0A0A9FZE6_ARUDO